MTELTWRKSSFSGSQANCVEVAACDRVLVRDTKNKSGAVLRLTPAPGAGSQTRSSAR